MNLCRDIENMVITPPANSAFYVDALPETGVEGLIYVTPDGDSFAMYKWEDGEWEEVSDCPVSPPEAEINDVTFIDYDGTVRYSYTADEFLALSEMPEDPTHDGLVPEGWNWSMEDAKDYVTQNGKLVIGEQYTTDDGKTRFYITIPPESPENRRFWKIYYSTSATGSIILDWGDGSFQETSNTSPTVYEHTYAEPGDYIVTLESVDGATVQFSSYITETIRGISWRTYLKRAVLTNVVDQVWTQVFHLCTGLTTVILPQGLRAIGERAFTSCYSLQSIVIPSSVAGIMTNAFDMCTSMKMISLPKATNYLAVAALDYCQSLKILTLPSGGTIYSGLCKGCSSLYCVVIPYTVEQIQTDAFEFCSGLTDIRFHFQGGIRLEEDAFGSCESIGAFHFNGYVVASIENNTFLGVPSDCLFYVRESLVDAYKADPAWSTYADRIVGE